MPSVDFTKGSEGRHRATRCYSEQRSYVPIYKEQLVRWAKLDLTSQQRSKVTRLQGQINDLDRIRS